MATIMSTLLWLDYCGKTQEADSLFNGASNQHLRMESIQTMVHSLLDRDNRYSPLYNCVT